MKNILYIGQFKDAAGYGNAARGYLRILDKFLNKSQYNLKIFALNFEKEDYSKGIDRELIQKYNLNPQELIQFINNNKYTLFLHALPTFYLIDTVDMPLNKCFTNNNCEKKINFISWETDKCPTEWKKIYNNKIFNFLCVSCSWNKECFKNDLLLDIFYIPLSVYDYYNLSTKIKNDKFRIFSMSQWTHRKGFDILIKAYYQEFFDQQDVELFIKTYRNETTKGSEEFLEKNIIIDDINKYKQGCLHYGKQPSSKIILKTGFSSEEEIKKYYQQSDVFCLPTRGEGFGMTIAQAILSGIPCILPDKGGHLDYIDKNLNFLVKSNYEFLYNLPFKAYSSKEMKIVEPSLASTREALRTSYNLWKENKLYLNAESSKKYTNIFLDEKKIFDQLINLTGE